MVLASQLIMLPLAQMQTTVRQGITPAITLKQAARFYRLTPLKIGDCPSKALIVEVALPMLFKRIKQLRLQGAPVRIGGWAFRGVLELPCKWQTV